MHPFPFDVDQLRSTVETALESATQLSNDCPDRLRDAIRYSLLAGGKRLRPILTILSCQICGGSVEQALPAACAMEMIHTYSLIHDDLPAMDDDDLRRGQATNHIQFDEATAILAGDALLTLAFEVLSTQIENPVLASKTVLELAQAAGANGMVGGQQSDLNAESQTNLNIDDLISIHRLKTGKLITCAVRMGAILAQASPEQLDAMTKYGNAVGLAFQIADDLLDETGTVEKMGKGVQKDQSHHKLTYPALLGLDESKAQAHNLVDSAISALSIFNEQSKSLEALARYSIERDQ
ncbi:MAG: polyprenyl synthetase family protein [Planctomycetaceae bacterium]|nr:polyprenyl synthetase family protein [Planctomycetaceae bacterium]